MSSSNCCFLTCIQVSQEAGKVVWYSHLFKNFPQFIVMQNPKRWCCWSAALNMPVNLENSAVATGLDWDFIPIAKEGNAKECSNYHKSALISHASKVMLKILQARLQLYMNQELPDVQAQFRKGRGTRDQIANTHWIKKKNQGDSRKTFTSASLTMLNPPSVTLTLWN